MNGKAVTAILALVLIAWVVAKNPVASGHAVHNVGTLLAGAVHGLSSFARNA